MSSRVPLLLALGMAFASLLSVAPAAADTPEKRAVPDYDGREEPTTAGDVLIWVPRVILSPFYLVSEFVLRRPLGFLISTAEREQVPQFLLNVFTFGTDGKAGIAPLAFLDFGFEPSVGLYFFWNDVLAEGHDLRLRGATWGSEWVSGSFVSRHHFGEGSSVAFRGTGTRRPDYVFYGIGPDALQRDEARYGATTFEGEIELEVPFWRSSRIRTQVGVRNKRFREGDFSDDPTLRERVAEGSYPLPARYDGGYSVIYNRVMLAIDSRLARPAPGSGVRLELRAEQMSPFAEGPPQGYIRYGAVLGGFYDLADRGRVLSLSAGVSFADAFDSDTEIPFTELSTLGGVEAMRGFYPGRLYGRSSAAATLAYRWPIWVFLDGSIQLSVGNVFGEHLEDFDLDLLRFSATIGIESTSSRDSALEVLLGLGTETFRHGGQLTSVRIIFGTHYGF